MVSARSAFSLPVEPKAPPALPPLFFPLCVRTHIPAPAKAAERRRQTPTESEGEGGKAGGRAGAWPEQGADAFFCTTPCLFSSSSSSPSFPPYPKFFPSFPPPSPSPRRGGRGGGKLRWTHDWWAGGKTGRRHSWGTCLSKAIAGGSGEGIPLSPARGEKWTKLGKEERSKWIDDHSSSICRTPVAPKRKCTRY